MGNLVEPIKITGLAEFNRSLRRVNTDLPKALRLAQNQGADLVVAWARPRVPERSGKARASVRASSTRTASRVSGGSARVPWYPWLDFGGRVGRMRSVHRAFLPGGRYIYPGYVASRDEIARILLTALTDLARDAGFEVTDG